jgi:hypothetical protein
VVPLGPWELREAHVANCCHGRDPAAPPTSQLVEFSCFSLCHWTKDTKSTSFVACLGCLYVKTARMLVQIFRSLHACMRFIIVRQCCTVHFRADPRNALSANHSASDGAWWPIATGETGLMFKPQQPHASSQQRINREALHVMSPITRTLHLRYGNMYIQ